MQLRREVAIVFWVEKATQLRIGGTGTHCLRGKLPYEELLVEKKPAAQLRQERVPLMDWDWSMLWQLDKLESKQRVVPWSVVATKYP
jgi:hypothetical protein